MRAYEVMWYFFLLQNVIAVATYLAKEKYISQWKQQLRK